MAHFAKLDNNNKVVSVLVVANSVITNGEGVEQEQLGIDFLNNLYGPGSWYKQTSYNKAIRKNFAGVGFTYDPSRDAFIPPCPFSSWALNETTCQYDPPITKPDDGEIYIWNEILYYSDNTKGWVLQE
jgi:hypothetical protein